MAKQRKRRAVVPEKLTLAWLWNHVPLSWWAALVGSFLFVFTLGISVGQSELYSQVTTPAKTSAEPATKPEARLAGRD
jgi:hypothetical protein